MIADAAESIFFYAEIPKFNELYGSIPASPVLRFRVDYFFPEWLTIRFLFCNIYYVSLWRNKMIFKILHITLILLIVGAFLILAVKLNHRQEDDIL